jgi:hypothetical protein
MVVTAEAPVRGPESAPLRRKRASPRRARRLAVVLWAALVGASSLLPSRAHADTTPPVVQLISPLAGSTLADPVVISANASDDIGVERVEFWLGTTKVGEISTPPYTMTWNPWTVQTGNYLIKAVARDAAGNPGHSNAALVTVFATPLQRSTFVSQPLPIVRDRLGLLPRDFAWGGAPSTVVDTGYLAYDRDPLSLHDLGWFQTYRPDWLVYDCNKRPIRYFGSPLLVFDITNPEVREYQYRVFVRYHIKRGSNGISIDNFFLQNYFGKCGVYDAQGVWRQKYTGQLDDPQYVRDAIDWLAAMASRIRAAGGLVALNLIDRLDHPDLERVASLVDLVYFEGGGFINTFCAPAWTNESWLLKFQVFRRIALGRGLAVQDQACDFMSQLTPELVSWDIANFFLVRGDRSYFSIGQSYVRRPVTDPDYNGPVLHAPLGAPVGEPQQQGVVWTRQYQNGLVVVNPSSVSRGTISVGADRVHNLQGRAFAGYLTVPPASGLVLVRDGPAGARAPVGVYRGATGEWFFRPVLDGELTQLAWGAPVLGDVPVEADYDGDRVLDVAVYRTTTGEWLIRRSRDGSLWQLAWGAPVLDDVPAPADYDGDGQADAAVYRRTTGEWLIRRSRDGGLWQLAWGAPALGDVPVPADYDGDRQADAAVYRRTTGEWLIRLSRDGGLWRLPWGAPVLGDVPAPADYDGDGRADVAVYRRATGQWFLHRSTDGGLAQMAWGSPFLRDQPVPADYDGDGRADIAVYRGGTGEWLVRRSRDGSLWHIAWGAPSLGDLPLHRPRPLR